MRIGMKWATLLKASFCVLLMSCTTGPAFQAVDDPTDREGLVYLYRPDSGPRLRKTTIAINEIDVCDLASKEYTWFKVKPGRYSLTATWGFGTQLPMMMIPLTVEPAQTLYVHIEAKTRVALIGVPYYAEVRHTDITIGPTPAAPLELSHARYIPPLQTPPDPLSD